MAWNIFESDVPPLKRSRPERASIEKSCFSTQHTQKSFSIMASGKPFRCRCFGEQVRALARRHPGDAVHAVFSAILFATS